MSLYWRCMNLKCIFYYHCVSYMQLFGGPRISQAIQCCWSFSLSWLRETQKISLALVSQIPCGWPPQILPSETGLELFHFIIFIFNFSFIRCIYSIYMHVFLINLINCGVINGTVIHVSIINIFLCLIYCVRFLSHKRSHVNRDGVINSIFKYVK